jgi:hypothetical protein
MGDASPQTHDVTFQVNDMPVTMRGPRVTGLEIKQAAIAAGVPIQLDFVLSEESNANRTRIVPDEEPVTINPTSSFDAVAGDDNS